ncbi:uncharacterized protein LOC129595854 [Paramacrobiotus metropolitanus]|uniref:uncharacterized protein LOC129595854 n=1 Tax=Paramacrobiotus metropolitanus TaxID=2943436 RepID=UPI002445A667|nr:uncharacterized protein LOC129595854 [Paramacrobiotus metropolitanus]
MDPGMAGFFMGGPGGDAPASRKPKYQGRFAVFREIYDDPFKWGLIKGVVVFAGGIYLARKLRGFDVMQVVQPPPPGMYPQF